MKRIGLILLGALFGAGGGADVAAASEPEPAPGAVDGALREADRRFVAGDLAGALAVLEPACAGSERPECAFSLGAIHHGLGHCGEALGHYRRYRALAPRGDRVEEVKAALEEVEGRCGDARAPQSRSGAARASTTVDASGSGAPVAQPASRRPALPPASAPGRVSPGPAAASAMTSPVMMGSFALSGAAAVGTLVFGVLATQSADDCGQARAYSDDFRTACEEDGPRYQGLWQGFAVASVSFLAIGVTLWWLDSSSGASVGVSGAGTPVLNYRREF